VYFRWQSPFRPAGKAYIEGVKNPTADLYPDREAYDIAYGWDSLAQTSALVRLAEQLCGRPIRRALEVACGPGRVLCDLARLKKQAFGLDCDPQWLAYAQRRLDEQDLTACLVLGDMRAFRLAAPADLAINPLNGISYLSNPDELAAHLMTIARNLTPGGIYVIEMSFAPIERQFIGAADPWTFARRGVRVTADWRLVSVEEDTGLAKFRSTLEVHRPGQTVRRVVTTHVHRKWDQPLFYAQIDRSPLRLAAILNGILQPLDPTDRLTYADGNVFVLLRR